MTASRGLRPDGKRDLPASAIDEAHLDRMTLGDRGLEREVLEIFLRQSALMLERIAGGGAAVTATAAHTLLGSARGIGAWRVAHAAERLERAATQSASEAEATEAVAELKAASLEAGAAISSRLTVLSAELARSR